MRTLLLVPTKSLLAWMNKKDSIGSKSNLVNVSGLKLMR